MSYFIDLFEEQVATHPGRTAVKHSEFSLNYQQLNKHANQLAHYFLHEYSIRPNDCIAILQYQSLDLLVAMLAAWKVGACFVVLNPGELTTKEKIQNLLMACDVKLIATTKAMSQHQTLLHEMLTQNHFWFEQDLSGEPIENPDRSSMIADPLAYYIETSGSTGTPKIVVVQHTKLPDSGLNALFVDISQLVEVNEQSTALWNCALTFDPIIALPGWIFAGGGSLYIPTQAEIIDMNLLMTNCVRFQVNIFITLPFLLADMLTYSDQLNQISDLRILTTGEKLTYDLVRKVYTTLLCCILFNAYGPTEGPIGLTLNIVRSTDEYISMGRVLLGRKIKIINTETYAETMPGEAGELIYQSAGFLGYLNNERETQQREILVNGERWWRSGDRFCFAVEDEKIKYDEDHVPILLFQGRIKNDNQVKICGVRMELDGIEKALREYPGIIDARTFVLPSISTERNMRIVTFCKCNEAVNLKQSILHYLRAKLRAVVRHSLVVLNNDETFSDHLTRNGKLNEKSLLSAHQDALYTTSKEVKSVREQLKKYWSDLFGIDNLPDNSHFYNLGGTSFDLITLFTRIEDNPYLKVINAAKLLGKPFHENPTLATLATIITTNLERQQRINYFYTMRDSKPVIIIDDLVEQDYATITEKQPIIQISPLLRPSLTMKEKVEDLAHCISLAVPTGPYFVVGKNAELLDCLKEKLAQYHFYYSVLISDIDLAAKLQHHYLLSVKIGLQQKIKMIKSNITHDVEDKLINTNAMLKNVRSQVTILLFGSLGSKKTTTVKQLQAQLHKESNERLAIYFDVVANNSFNIMNTLQKDGFTREEIFILQRKPIVFIFDGIENPKALEKIMNDTDIQLFKAVSFVFAIDPGILHYKNFTVILDQRRMRYKQYVLQNNFIDNAMSVQQWFVYCIEKQMPTATQNEKAFRFMQYHHYCRTLATSFGFAKECKIDLPLSIWEYKNRWRSTLQRLQDTHNKLTHAAIQAAPIKIKWIGDYGLIRFLNDELLQQFKNDALANTPIDNPYQKKRVAIDPSLDLQLIMKIHNENSGGQPIFLLPPITGETSYQMLIYHLSERNPVYEFKHPAWSNLSIKFTNLQQLAAFYAHIISSIHPIGAIALGGWSFGGTTACAVAELLIAQNRQINYLGIIDSPGPRLFKFMLDNPQQHKILLMSRIQWILDHYDIANKQTFIGKIQDIILNGLDAIDYVWQLLQEHIECYGASTDPRLSTIVALCRDHYLFTLEYQTNNIPNAARIYRATLDSIYYPLVSMPDLGWSINIKHVNSIVDTDHFTIIQDSIGAQQLAEAMQQDFKAATLTVDVPFLNERLCSFTLLQLQHLNKIENNDYIPLDIECVESESAKYICIDTLWQQIQTNNGMRNTVLLGEAGVGKSTTVSKLYQQLATNYLKGHQRIFPLLIRLNQYSQTPLQSFFNEIALSETQKNYLFTQEIVIILDGVDEISKDALIHSIQNIRLLAKKLVFIFTCKINYFNHQIDINDFFKFEMRSQILTLRLPNTKQIDLLQALFTRKAARQMTNSEKEYIKNQHGRHKITPLYLQTLMNVLPSLDEKLFHQVISYTRAELFEYDLIQRALKNNIDLKILLYFAENLAVLLYLKEDKKITPKQYPWEEESTQFDHLIWYDRFDTDTMISALQLQKHSRGYTFSHHSYQEYCFARVIWHEIMHKDLLTMKCCLNQYVLCYEHDLLQFIADLYHTDIFARGNTTKMSAERRQYIQDNLHAAIALAKNNPQYKILAANALSILTVCRDLRLQFPVDFFNLYLDRVNFTNANLTGLDLSSVFAEPALLDGAQLTDTLFPPNWSLDYQSLLLPCCKQLQQLFDGTIVATQFNTMNQPERPQVPFTKPDVSFINISGSPRHFVKPELDVPNIQVGGLGDYIGLAELHPNGNVHALYSLFTRNHIYEIGYNTTDHYTLQIFENGNLVRTYLRMDENSVERLNFIKFHPLTRTLFALGHKRHLYAKPICLSLIIFNPNEEIPYVIENVCSPLEKFVIHPTYNCLIFVREGCNKQMLGKGLTKRSITLIDIDNYQDSQIIIPLSELIGDDYSDDVDIVDIETFNKNPFVVFATKSNLTIAVYIYDFVNRRLLISHKFHGERFSSLAVNSNDTNIAIAFSKDILIWDYRTDEIYVAYKKFGDSKKLLLTDNKLHMLDMTATTSKRTIDSIDITYLTAKSISRALHYIYINMIIQHPHEPIVAVVSNGGKISFIDSRTGYCLSQFIMPKVTLPTIRFSDDGLYCFIKSVNEEYMLDIYSLTLSKVPHPVDNYYQFTDLKFPFNFPMRDQYNRATVSCAKFDKEKKRIGALMRNDSVIDIYDVCSAEVIYQLQDASDKFDFDFAPNRDYVVTVGIKRQMIFWRQNHKIQEATIIGDLKNNALSICWTREDLVYVGDREGDLYCFDVSGIYNKEAPRLIWSTVFNLSIERNEITKSAPSFLKGI